MVKQIVLPLFYDIDPSDVRHQKRTFGEAFARVEYKFKADKVKLTKWKAALEKVANFSGFELGDRDESEFIQDIIKWVDSKMVDRTPLNVVKYPVGIESRVQDIYQHLNMGRNDIICMVGIFGYGGIGKTTISKEVYNRISYQFEGSCFLKNIRETSKVGGLIQLQKRLLYEILGIGLECHDTDKGINVIRHRLCSKRVLLILDDVDDLVQLETLAGARDWFGPGSRIIITTRDQHLLNISKVDSKYEVKRLDHNEALELFSWHAFEEDKPIEDYVELSKQVMQYAKGLPQVLIVVGSDLRVQNINHWISTLEKYKRIPNKNIQEVLCVSYDGLNDNEKNIFLDIAFFLKGEFWDHVVKILDSCGFSLENGIKRLIDKCLITITTSNQLWMHNLLQDMGREIVRKECEDPGARSRLWSYEDARYVLEENAGTNNVVGINVDLPILPEGDDHDMICLSPKLFAKMKRLRFFISRGAHFCGRSLNYLSNELRVLDWSNCPLQFLPSNFRGQKLIDFKLYGGRIKEIITGKFKNLTIMRFSGCKFLTRILNFSSCSNLKYLTIETCEKLVEIHDSVGFLDKLGGLDLRGCPNLKSFPRRLKLRSLRYLTLYNCSKLQNFPQIECKMELLSSFFLEGTPIKEWPSSSIGYLTTALNSLSVTQNHREQLSPKEICLSEYSIYMCKKDKLDSSINGCFAGIEDLYIHGSITDLMRLPVKIPHLQHLKSLYLSNHPYLAIDEIHSSIGYLTGLQKLYLSTSLEFDGDPTPSFNNWYLDSFSIYCSSTLQELDLSLSDIDRLPPSIESFIELRILKLRQCYEVQEILHLPPNLQKLDAYECWSLERCPEVWKKFPFYTCGLRELRWIDLSNCHKLDANIGS